MEPGIIVAIILVLVAGGTAVALSRQRSLSLSLPGFRGGGALASGSLDEPVDGGERQLTADSSRLEPVPLFGARPGLPSDDQTLPEPPHIELPPAPMTLLGEQIERVEQRLEALQRAVEQQSARVERLRADVAAQAERDAKERAAALDRLRADLATMVGTLVSGSRSEATDRRQEVTGELYARLARLESAFSAVSNPILLPGEDYVPPAELLPEALIWENWNEVGERAFALADAFSAQRLYLSAETRETLGRFVTELRVLLTRSVYPNLQTDPDAAQEAALRESLEELAAELPKVRAALDREYQHIAGS